MRTEPESFFAALRFFTRLPVPAWVGHSTAQLDHAARHLPLVGVIVGVLGAAVTWAALQPWPAAIAITLGMIATILATGAFHEDGLADSIDGFGGGWTRADVLRIMKDSRIGAYGAIGIALALLAKFNALAALPPAILPVALVAGHAASRLAAVALMATLDYVRDDAATKSRPLTRRLGGGGLAFAALCGLLPCLLLPVAQAIAALALVVLVTLLAAHYFVKRIGGYTGDCLGATQQVSEIAFYLGLACACTW